MAAEREVRRRADARSIPMVASCARIRGKGWWGYRARSSGVYFTACTTREHRVAGGAHRHRERFCVSTSCYRRYFRCLAADPDAPALKRVRTVVDWNYRRVRRQGEKLDVHDRVAPSLGRVSCD